MELNFVEGLAFVLMVLSALAVVTLKNAVHAALAIIGNFLVVAAAYVALDARFAAMAQLIVYGGAIVVLFLFVIMLLSAANSDVGKDILPGLKWPAGLAAAVLGGGLVYVLATFKPQKDVPSLEGGLAEALGGLLYDPNKWLFAMLAVGFLLLVATVAAVVLVEPERLVGKGKVKP